MIDTQVQNTETRRGVVRKFFAGAAALLLAGTIAAGGLPTDVNAGTGIFKTTAALNLRCPA